jgi:purine-binding chemotaxis protein CheW
VPTATTETPTISSVLGEGSGTIQMVSFRLAEEEYGIEITKVQEIILMGSITRVPQTPDYIKGLINLRSTVIPIVDLRLRFGLPEENATDETRIMVVNVAGKTIGIIVDAVSEVLRVAEEQIAPPPPTVTSLGQDYLTGLVKLENRLLTMVDIDKVLGGEHGAELTGLSEAAV